MVASSIPAEDLPMASGVAAVFARASDLLLSEESAARALELITEVAKVSLRRVVGAGVTLIDATGHASSTAVSDPVVERADAQQFALGQGPCLSAWAEGASVLVVDVATDARWPLWSAAVAAEPIRSAISAPLIVGGATLGAVKVYSNSSGAFDAGSVRLLELFAAQAAILLAHAQARDMAAKLNEDLSAALAQRDRIAMAKGILMARHGIDEHAALRKLIQSAASTGTSLHDMAEGIASQDSASDDGQ